MTIAQNLNRIREQVEELAKGHPVLVLAVSKGQPPEKIREACQAGQKAFGESYVQEALQKQALLSDLALEWHFIGPLQSNKTTPVALHFDWVHGIDRIKIAERLSNARIQAGLPPLNACLQVNLSGESSKSGVTATEVTALAREVGKLVGIRLRGLMTLPEPTADAGLQRKRFAQLRMLKESLREQGIWLDTLSMGMSEDFASAVMEGSTIVRIGTALFGERQLKP
ncbi:MAG: YggS family pyridoxal phosphate-dependent enzyme [Betaproteobacteria bacterium]|nr:YggS family pyridoxal phosphate-dependent enzyme [Betaproteobacteria bacterium]MDE2622079.1 YggS family pyridoxal phosphate-dependent enzyme [Betaproteobacteria bacterium]